MCGWLCGASGWLCGVAGVSVWDVGQLVLRFVETRPHWCPCWCPCWCLVPVPVSAPVLEVASVLGASANVDASAGACAQRYLSGISQVEFQ
jgi:hypothetical protein